MLLTAASQTAHRDSPAPTIAPQLRQIVGRMWSELFGESLGKIRKGLHTNKRDASYGTTQQRTSLKNI
jgi:hypothetical protein